VRELSSGAAEDPASTALHIDACIQLINYGWRVGLDEAEARRLFEEARPLAERLGDRPLLARLLERYAMALSFRGRSEECLRWSQAAIEIADEVGNAALRVVTRIAAGSEYYYFEGNLRKALAECEQSIEIADGDLRLGFESVGFHPLLFWLMLRGLVWSGMGKLARARGQLDEVLERVRELDDRELLCWASSGQAVTAVRSGQLADARAHADRSAHYAMETGGFMSRVFAFDALASVSVATGQWEDARSILENGLRVTREMGMTTLAGILAMLARVDIESGRSAEARDTIGRGLEIAQRQGQGIGLCRIQLEQARLLLRDPGAPAAEEIDAALQQAETGILHTGAEVYRPEIHELRAELAQLRADDDARERELREAHRLYEEMGATGHAGRLAGELGL
jgi:tetratricopeptide (TPR) repeat protein